jgi:uncharacterized damage-inducible protein DinB
MKRPDKSQLLKKYASSRAMLRDFLAVLSEPQAVRPTDEAGWTIKDHLAHLAAWQNGITALLQRKPRFKAMGLPESAAEERNVDRINEQIRAAQHGLTLAQVVKLLNDADKNFRAVLTKLPSADLFKPYAYYAKIRKPSEQENEPVYGWVEGNSWHHIEEHLPWMQQIIVDERAANLTEYGAGFAKLEAALAETPREMWQFRPAPGEWSVHEIIVHLADSELNAYARVRKALVEPGSTIFGYDQDGWAKTLDYHRRDVGDALQLLRLVRKMTHELLAGEPADVWSRSFFHPEMNRQITLDEWVIMYAGHIPAHIEQIRANVAAWRAA